MRFCAVTALLPLLLFFASFALLDRANADVNLQITVTGLTNASLEVKIPSSLFPASSDDVPALQKLAHEGDSAAQYKLGLRYIEGVGIETNIETGTGWLKKSAENGDVHAATLAGIVLIAVAGKPGDVKAGIDWLEKAAAEDDPEALLNLGVIYFHGVSVPKDSKKAVEMFVKSAIRGNHEAERYLGTAYVNGSGVPQETPKAIDLFRASASKGDAVAQLNLGETLWASQLPDYQSAFMWISNSASQGVRQAAGDLGIMYEEGLGVERNMVESLKWSQLAVNKGFSASELRRDEVMALMDSNQIKEAERQVSMFTPSPSHAIPIVDSEEASCEQGPDLEIPAKISGNNAYLVPDTGATYTCLDIKYQAVLGEELARESLSGTAGIQEIALYSGPEISIGKKRLTPFFVTSGNLEMLRQISGRPCDGILGMDALKDHIICFDSDKPGFSIGGEVPGTVKRNAQAIPLKKSPERNIFGIEGYINGVGPIFFAIDSGNESSVSLAEHDWRRVSADKKNGLYHENSVGFGGRIENNNIVRLQRVTVGTNTYIGLIADLPFGGQSVSKLGRGFIRRHICAIDFPNSMLYLLPGSQFGQLEERDMSGLHILSINGKKVVHSVDKDTPAFKAGVRNNDEIVSINGKNAPSLEIQALREMLKSNPGAKITLQIERDGTTKSLAFFLKRFI